ncbi:zinc finger-like protein [Galdieria sulphuraria]|uniref:Zinc finger-like protein n=1 Tax=Galdieria sulphuraria TaxID=130081 RepID=M2XL31_GALSU|nr:zinc finger-like protein [Galdieria sulphuraria]EME30832.1 zinc finger-like protein [Galdieria sulphuraria]|eukprot:XP_005707352.1 zinc finger-like protein [Galdieria sulphuraria]
MQHTELVSCLTRPPRGSPTIRDSENPDSVISPKQQTFTWEPFVGSIVTEKKPETTGGSCSESVTIAYPNSLRRECVSVVLQRNFIFDEERYTWKWFKTWRLPEIRVFASEQESFFPSFVRLSVVCPTQDLHLFEEVGLLGRTQAQLVNGESRFTRLRLLATSNSYEGRNFHLFISFFSQTACCLGALVSTGFVVYARGPNTTSFQEGVLFSRSLKAQSCWFSPELLTRPFMKKVFSICFCLRNCRLKICLQVRNEQGIVEKEPIENTTIGLMRYFQAPNIRFKCRDPIFLALRFYKVIVLFLNSSILSSEDCDIYFEFLAKLSEYRSSHRSSLSNINHLTRYSSSVFPLCLFGVRCNLVLRENERTVLIDNLESCQDEAIWFVKDVSVRPKRFIELTDVVRFQQAYERFFSWYTNVFMVPKQVEGNQSASYYEMLENIQKAKTSDYRGMELDSNLSEPSLPAVNERMVPCTSEASELMSPTLLDVPKRASSELYEFVRWFRQFHSLLKRLLEEMTMSASHLVMNLDEANKAIFIDCFKHFQRALTVHTHIEDAYGFAELMKQRPLIFEAYRIDHTTEEEELERIVSLSSNMQIENVGELFIRVSSFASLLCQHMDKEEKHLLPCAIQLLSETELKELVMRMNEESQCVEGWKNLSTIS